MTTRRHFLKFATATTAALVAPAALARVAPAGERTLKLYNLHTGEHMSATYWVDGLYVPDEMAAINHILRDYRTDEVRHMDRRLFDLLYTLQQRTLPGTGKRGAFHVISGYRSPKTNRSLSRMSSGVAKHSLHTKGQAIDIRLPGVELKHLRQAALQLRAGGVGYYPRSNFVHVDTGRPRFW